MKVRQKRKAMKTRPVKIIGGYYCEKNAGLLLGVSRTTLRAWQRRREKDGPPTLMDARKGVIYPSDEFWHWMRNLPCTAAGIPQTPPMSRCDLRRLLRD